MKIIYESFSVPAMKLRHKREKYHTLVSFAVSWSILHYAIVKPPHLYMHTVVPHQMEYTNYIKFSNSKIFCYKLLFYILSIFLLIFPFFSTAAKPFYIYGLCVYIIYILNYALLQSVCFFFFKSFLLLFRVFQLWLCKNFNHATYFVSYFLFCCGPMTLYSFVIE